MKNILFLASPGAGKGTQSEILAQKFNLIHISSGSLLRQEIASDSELGKQIKSIIAKGNLVSDEIIIKMIQNQLDSKPNAAGFIFDGFPRTAKQAEALDKMLTEKKCPLKLVIILEITSEEMVERLLKRAEIEGRRDDNEETIKARGIIFTEQTTPLINYYAAHTKTVAINGSREIPVIAAELEEIVGNL